MPKTPKTPSAERVLWPGRARDAWSPPPVQAPRPAPLPERRPVSRSRSGGCWICHLGKRDVTCALLDCQSVERNVLFFFKKKNVIAT